LTTFLQIPSGHGGRIGDIGETGQIGLSIALVHNMACQFLLL
jgi:hypothetical protein